MRRCLAWAIALGSAWTTVLAQPTSNRPLHRWESAVNPEKGQAYFTNLQNGAQIETPFVVRFGLSGGWGLSSIDKKAPGKHGHHHLLVNRDLPLDFTKPLPFNAQYIHFGQGQMETVLNLEPGTHTLRMLLANEAHIPHFVYSKPIQVTVTRKNKAASTPAASPKVELLGLDKPLNGPFVLRFHASGLRVAPQSQGLQNTGHFKLTLRPAKGAPEVLDFFNGETEVGLAMPAGIYSAALDFVDNLDAKTLLAPGASGELRVTSDQ